MKQRSRAQSGAAVGVVLLGLVWSGCVRPRPPAISEFAPGTVVDTVEAEAERDTQPPVTLNRNRAEDLVIARAPTPALPRPIDSLSDHELVTYLNSLHWKTSWSHYSTQRANAPCIHRMTNLPCAKGDSAKLLIQPEAGMSKWEYADIPPNGLVVGRIVNDASGDRDADSLGFRAGAKTWWVVDDSGGTLRSRFFVRTDSVNAPIRFVTRTRPFIRCLHQDAPNGRSARGKFWNCSQSTADSLRAAAPSGDGGPAPILANDRFHFASFESRVPLPAAPRPLAMLTAAWVSCAAGCCSTGP